MKALNRRLTPVAILGITLVALLFGVSPANALAPKIALQHASSSLLLTSETTTNYAQPDEPLVCQDLLAVCDITLDFSASIPLGLSMTSGGVLHWASGEWFQTRPFTLTLDDSTAFAPGQVVNITATAVSNSEYYSGYVVTLPVTVGTLEPPSAGPTTGPLAGSGALPDTGLSVSLTVTIALIICSVGLSAIVATQRSRRRDTHQRRS